MRTLVLRTIGGDRADLPHAGAVEMWLRTSAVSEIGFLVGVDRRNSRHHAVNMNKRDFSQAPLHGQLIDLKQRWQSFAAVFAGGGGKLDDSATLLQVARRTLARQALERVN